MARARKRSTYYMLAWQSWRSHDCRAVPALPRLQPPLLLLFARKELCELLLVRVVIEIAVEVVARLHELYYPLLAALAPDAFEDPQCGRVHGAESGERVERHRDVRGSQLLRGEERRLAELRDVGKYRHLHRVGELPVHGEIGDRFREYHVGTRFHAPARALHRRLEPL